MDWKIKTAIVGSSIVLVSSIGFIIKTQYDTINKLKAIETSVVESKNIGNGIVRAQSSYATKSDLETIIKQNNLDIDKIRQDLKNMGADVKTVQVIKTTTPGYSGQNIPSTNSVANSNVSPENTITDKYGYLKTTQWLEIKEPFTNTESVPFGKTGFSAGQEKPWSLEIKPRTYKTTTVTGQDEDGRTFAYSKVSIEVDGKNYTVPVSENKMVEEYPDNHWMFSPRLFLGIDGGMILSDSKYSGEIFPNVGVSMFSYGKVRSNPTWTFLGIGGGYETKEGLFGLSLTPANYNIGKHLPLVDNMFVGPSISLDMKANVGVYLGLHVGL